MRVIFDIEANGLENPDQVWLVVAKDIDTNDYHIFRNLTQDDEENKRFLEFGRQVKLWVGHNALEFDLPTLSNCCGLEFPGITSVLDTLVLSRMIDYPRDGHSVESYGKEFGIEKGDYSDWSRYSKEMEDYCIRDVDITHKIYLKYLKYISNTNYNKAITLEHKFQYYVINVLHNNGFYFNSTKAIKLLAKVKEDLELLDRDILSSFLPKLKLIREVTPKATKYGTISLSSIPKVLRENIHEYTIDAPFSFCKWEPFNPSSHKQIISVLNEAGWKPEDKTKTHVETERNLSIRKRQRNRSTQVDLEIEILYNDLERLRKTGWKVNEHNLSTLPETAPPPARTLAKRILLEARRRSLTEWLGLVCLEIKIEKKSIDVLGRAIRDQMILNGVPRNKNITEKDIEKEILSCLENPTFTIKQFTPRNNEKENIILNLPTELVLKSLIRCIKHKKAVVKSVVESESSVLITVMPPEGLEDFSANPAILYLDGLKTTGFQYKIISQRIKGKFYGLGAWTHRMAHQNPNTANIPNEFDTFGNKKLLGKELRSLWCAPPKRLLVGVDAEGIQLRIFAHYIDDPEFTKSLVEGKKEDKSDPHSLNQRILGDACKTRAAAKRFIYAMLLGAGMGKLSEILGSSREETEAALQRLMDRYQGFKTLKETTIPRDGKRGFFLGLDGRAVRIPGDTQGARSHLAMSGYLQNGEAVVMKMATLKWIHLLDELDAKLVNFVHDEWQTECPNNVDIALQIAKLQADSLREVGEELNLKCPLAGSYWNDDLNDYTIHTNWSLTH